jgi:HAD superfamily hydrolase (TIGR01484 family)
MAIGNQIFDNEKEEFIYNTYMTNSTTLNILTDIRNKYKSFFLTTLDKELFLDNYLPNNKNTDMMLKAFNVKKVDLIDYIIKTKKYPCKFFFFDEYKKLKIIYDDLKNKYSELDFYFDSKLIDIVPNKMNKGLGIDYILDLLKIDVSESIAIGDSINDISMFNHVGVKVAVSNACLELKDAADLIIDNSRNEAVADLIERVINDKI